IQVSLESFQAQGQAYVGGVAIHEPVAEATRPLPVRRIPATEEASTGPSAQPHDDTSENIFRDTPSIADAKTGADTDKTNSGGDTEILQFGDEQGDDVTEVVNLEDKSTEIDEGQAGSDPGKTPESRPPPDDNKIDKDQARPDPGKAIWLLLDQKPMHDEFMANVYPKVHESLKFPADEHVILEDPPSSTRTLSSMKNLEDAYTIGDQFFNDKSIEDEPGKLNVEAEVVMVTVLIYQASSSVPPLSTPVIDLLPPKPASSTTQAQSLQLQQQPAPLKDRFRDLPKADMKEMLHQRMFETGSYKLLPEHVALYEALEAFIERAQMDEFFAKRGKSRKRRRDDQDPPPPPPDLDLSKTKRHDSEAPSRSSKQQSGPHAEQLVEDIPIPNTANISDSEDTDSAHLLKIKQSPEWLKRILEEDRPKTPKLDWSVPPNDLPKPENNQENALANSYKDLEENKLVQKTSDIGSFITWFCKRIGKKKLSKSDLEGPTYKVAKAFHENNISLQFQMEKYHRMLTDQVNLVNPEGHRLVPDVRKPLPQGGPPDFRLEELVSSLWIESEREYDIGAAYGISHWWFKHKEFYITRHSAPSDRSTVRSHMRILSVVSLKTYERFGYAFLKEIVLRRVDYKEYKISEADFKNLHLNDFEDLYMLHLQGQLNHLSGEDKVHLFNAVNLWIRNIVIKKMCGRSAARY
ncbi:hypothetical protein Tco_0942427, partial [Tanacetum coccineum]